MTWSDFYLVCFLVGFLLSACSVLLGSFDLHVDVGHDAGGGFHFHVGGDHAGHVAGADHGAGADAQAGHVSPVNVGTAAAFLAWFGGSGFLLARFSRVWALPGLGLAIVVGLAGAAIVFAFVVNLSSPDENLDAGDYEMAGVLGRVVSRIRPGGTGEIIYSQEGTRRTCGARTEDGREAPKGTEVVVTRYEKGIAYVRRWDEMAREAGIAALDERTEAGPAAGQSS